MTMSATEFDKVISATNRVKSRGVVGVAVNCADKFGHYSQLGSIRANLDVKMFHVVWGVLPPISRMIGSIIRIIDSRWLSILRAGRPIKVETVEPNPSAVKHLPSMVFTQGLCGIWEV
jgi:hypothetical protein